MYPQTSPHIIRSVNAAAIFLITGGTGLLALMGIAIERQWLTNEQIVCIILLGIASITLADIMITAAG